MTTYFFVKVDGVWQKPVDHYPVARYHGIKDKDVEIYELNLDDLKQKNLVWKNH